MIEKTIKLKKLHTNQQHIIDTCKRFNVLKCGRRFGKTELTKELSINPMLDGKIIGYWCPTYKDLYEVWNELKYTLYNVTQSKDEQVKQITLITGGKIDMWSLEDPNSGRGRKYHRIIIDEAEKARHLKDAWEQTIRATLVDYEGDAWFMSTPKFGETYFKETLFKNESKYEDWKSWRFSSYDNPHLNKEEVDAARVQLDDVTFRCEYLAEDVDVTIRPFAYQWNDKFVTEKPAYDWKKQLVISVDFNLTPFCATLHHIWHDSDGWHWHQFDEIEIVKGSIPEMIDRLTAPYGVSLPSAILTGDSMGKTGQLGERDNASQYIQLLRGLGMRESQLRVRGNPRHTGSRTMTNYVLANLPDFQVHSRCKGSIRDWRNVQIDAFGEIQKKNRNDLNQRADFIDTNRYVVHNILNAWIDQHQKANKYI